MLLEISNLCKKYSKKSNYAIEDINIVGKSGEIIGILGHNGAGKSTTIKCITGMHPYEEGSISIAGYDLATDPINAKKNAKIALKQRNSSVKCSKRVRRCKLWISRIIYPEPVMA